MPLEDMAGSFDHRVGTSPASSPAFDGTPRDDDPIPTRTGGGVDQAFLATLAHEFRNPLAPIRSAVEIMRVIGQRDPALEKAREVISRQVDQLSRLVDQLLDVSRLTQGTLELARAPVDLGEVIRRAIELAQPLITERGHRLQVSLPQSPAKLDADLLRLAQSVAHLLDNAARYTDQPGEIVLSAAAAKDTVTVTVKDSGSGIAPDFLPIIFELFKRGHHSPEHPQPGLGVGLSLVRTIVEMHGGTVEARSEGPGHGSEFTIRLPLLRRGTKGEPKPRTPAGREALRRIVLIDDNRDGAESLAMLLRLKGHEVHVAYDGPSGMVLAQKTRPDCVLIDIGLPGMDGYEVARGLRAGDATGTLLVALTGYGQSEDKRRSQQAGFDYHLVKPVPHEVLDELLRER